MHEVLGGDPCAGSCVGTGPALARGRPGVDLLWCSWAALGSPYRGCFIPPSRLPPSLTPSAHQYDQTPLHLAALNGHLSVIELLVAKGAEVEAKDRVSEGPGWDSEGPYPPPPPPPDVGPPSDPSARRAPGQGGQAGAGAGGVGVWGVFHWPRLGQYR